MKKKHIDSKSRNEQVNACIDCIQNKKHGEIINRRKLITYLKNKNLLTAGNTAAANKEMTNIIRSPLFKSKIEFIRTKTEGKGYYQIIAETLKIKRDRDFDSALKQFRISCPLTITIPLEEFYSFEKIDINIRPCMVIFILNSDKTKDKVLSEHYTETLIYRLKKLFMKKGPLYGDSYLVIKTISSTSCCIIFENDTHMQKFYNYLNK